MGAGGRRHKQAIQAYLTKSVRRTGTAAISCLMKCSQNSFRTAHAVAE